MGSGVILDSWKAVADYLNHSIRTCQRLEREAGLPIHRVDDSPKSRVYADSEELDQWLRRAKHHGLPSSRRRLIMRAGLAVGYLVVLIVTVFVALRAGRLKKSVDAPSRPPVSLAVLPVLNDTGDAGREVLGGRLQRRIIAEIRAKTGEGLAVVNAPAVAESLKALDASGRVDPSESLIRSLMRRTEATHLFVGHFWKKAGGWTLSYDLFGPSDRPASASVSAGEDPLDLAPLVADKLLPALGLTASPGRSPGLEPGLKAAGDDPGPFLEEAQAAERASVSEFDPERLRQAVGLYRQAIAARPGSARAHFGLGHCYQNEYYGSGGSDQAALEAMAAAYREALRLNPGLPEALLGAGWTQLLSGNVDEAYAWFKKARDLAPAELEVNYYTGAFLGHIGLADRAVFYLTRAIDLGDRSTRAYRLRAFYETLAGQFGAAERDTARLCVMNPASARAFAVHARSLLLLNDLEGARHEITVAMVLAPEDPDVRLAQAVLWAAEGEKDKAIGALRAFRNHSPVPGMDATAVYAFLCLPDEMLAEIRAGLEISRRRLHRVDYPFPLLNGPLGPVCGVILNHPGYRQILRQVEAEKDSLRKKLGGL
ncbi:MAG: tetratricopeptide repeat protein [Acidobacteriota bacterium]